VETTLCVRKDCFENLKVERTRKAGGNKTCLTCPICAKKTGFKWKNFEKAHLQLNQGSAFDKELKKLLDEAFPVQKIDSIILGRKMPIFLEYTLDFYCPKCGTPFRIFFAFLESITGEGFYIIKSVLYPQKQDIRP
jgi:hypothetical protein